MVIWEAKWGDGDDCRLRAQQEGRVVVQKIQKREQSEQEGGRWMATQK